MARVASGVNHVQLHLASHNNRIFFYAISALGLKRKRWQREFCLILNSFNPFLLWKGNVIFSSFSFASFFYQIPMIAIRPVSARRRSTDGVAGTRLRPERLRRSHARTPTGRTPAVSLDGESLDISILLFIICSALWRRKYPPTLAVTLNIKYSSECAQPFVSLGGCHLSI